MRRSLFKIAFCTSLLACGISPAQIPGTLGEAPLDTFGIVKLYPTKAGTVEWNSAHWANGTPRGIAWAGDGHDPLGYTENHSAGSASPSFFVDGEGVLQMMSSGPRFHINSMAKGADKTQFFRDVEFTAYYRRGIASAKDGEKDYGGMVMGVRSGPLGHASSGGNDCDASTYYARIRHDGKWDFEKEWKHPASYYQSMGVIGRQTPLWGGKPLEANRWIGMKFVVYNLDDSSVMLEMYIDTTSGGETAKAKWELLGSALDQGKDWSGAGNNVAYIEGCADYNGLTDAYAPILEGHGTALMRTDGPVDNAVQAEYKFVSIREIDPAARFADSAGSTDTVPVPEALQTSRKNHGDFLPDFSSKKDALGRRAKGNVSRSPRFLLSLDPQRRRSRRN